METKQLTNILKANMTNKNMNNIDKQYQLLLQDILDNGIEKKDRTGTGTISVFGRQIRHKMSEGFPLLTTKKLHFKSIVVELLWFLRGDTNIKYLVDNNCHIWDGDAYKNYCNNCKDEKYLNSLPLISLSKLESFIVNCVLYSQEEFINRIKTDDEFAKRWGELGPIYGKQWRKWNCLDEGFANLKEGEEIEVDFECINISHQVDQIQNLINDLKTNPDSRRLLVSAWNPSDLPKQVLPPCHYGFQVYTRELSLEERHQLALPIWKEKYGPLADMMVPTNVDNTPYKIPTRAISLMWNQRSCDFPLGIPANIMSYALLLMMLSKQVNMVPEELIGNLGDCHIYLNQIDGVKEQLTREPLPLPNVILSDRVVNDLSEYIHTDIILENYQSHPKIYFPLSN